MDGGGHAPALLQDDLVFLRDIPGNQGIRRRAGEAENALIIVTHEDIEPERLFPVTDDFELEGRHVLRLVNERDAGTVWRVVQFLTSAHQQVREIH